MPGKERMNNDYAKNKTVRGQGNTPSSLKYRVTIDDPTDNGSVMDTERPQPKGSPYPDMGMTFVRQRSIAGGIK